jgi:hypothetical protein
MSIERAYNDFVNAYFKHSGLCFEMMANLLLQTMPRLLARQQQKAVQLEIGNF